CPRWHYDYSGAWFAYW
nr:immunoglobulin heavy chain junction region [Mus musculus]